MAISAPGNSDPASRQLFSLQPMPEGGMNGAAIPAGLVRGITLLPKLRLGFPSLGGWFLVHFRVQFWLRLEQTLFGADEGVWELLLVRSTGNEIDNSGPSRTTRYLARPFSIRVRRQHCVR